MAAANICMPFRPAFENTQAIPGAKAVITLAGTTTLVNVYSNVGLSVAAANPVVANSVGRFPQRWVDDAVSLRMRVFAADADIDNDDPIEDFDPYTPVETGSIGPTGASTATVSVGTVTTGAAGTSAIVTNAGTATAAILNFTIPRGDVGAGSTIADADYGDITVSGSGTVYTIDNAAVSLAKMANLAEDRIIGRQTAGAGVPEALTIGVSAATDIPDRAAADSRYVLRTESLVHSIYVPASAMVAQTTTGAAVGLNESTTNDIMRSSLDFDASTIEYAQFQIAMPNSWNEGTVTMQFYWEAANTGDVVWGGQGVCISNDDTMDAAFGTGVTVTDSVTATTDLMVTSATAAITLAGTPTAGDLAVFRVYRNASSGSDTCAVDARLLGVKLNFTTNAADDS
jgi:hypothetical protein